MEVLAALPWGLASASIQAPALPGLKLSLSKEVAGGGHVLPLVACGHRGKDKTKRVFFAGVEDGNLRLSVPNIELKFA